MYGRPWVVGTTSSNELKTDALIAKTLEIEETIAQALFMDFYIPWASGTESEAAQLMYLLLLQLFPWETMSFESHVTRTFNPTLCMCLC